MAGAADATSSAPSPAHAALHTQQPAPAHPPASAGRARVIRRLPVRPAPAPTSPLTTLAPLPPSPLAPTHALASASAPGFSPTQSPAVPRARSLPHDRLPVAAFSSPPASAPDAGFAMGAAEPSERPRPGGMDGGEDGGDADLAGVPTSFLENYPFPAFAVAVPRASAASEPTPPASPAVVWANAGLRALAPDGDLAARLAPADGARLAAWLTDAGAGATLALPLGPGVIELCQTSVPRPGGARMLVVTSTVRADDAATDAGRLSVPGSARAVRAVSADSGMDQDSVAGSAGTGEAGSAGDAGDAGDPADPADPDDPAEPMTVDDALAAAETDSIVLQILRTRASVPTPLGWRRAELEKNYRDLALELRAYASHAPVGIFRCDTSGRVIYVNSTWREQADFWDDDVDLWGDWIDDGSKDEVRRVWEDFFTRDEVVVSADWQWKNGVWVTTKVIRLEKVDEGMSGILGCVTDITQRKQHEELQRVRVAEAEQRRAEAEEARRQQELLIDCTSHELRNPISSMMQCAALVKVNLEALLDQLEAALDGGGRPLVPTDQLVATLEADLQGLENIYQCGLTQERISNDVLSLGKIQLDRLHVCPVATDLYREAARILSAFRTEAMTKRINLSLIMGDGVRQLGGHAVKTDPVRLGQVITNLLSNSIRFTSTSSRREIELHVDLGLQRPADGTCEVPPARPILSWTDGMPIYIYVSVTDTGPGLSPADLAVLFQRFRQVSPATHTVYGGSGLGLFVCRKITDHMGGRIDVVSTPGVGSTFRFFVEAAACAPAKRPHSDEQFERAAHVRHEWDADVRGGRARGQRARRGPSRGDAAAAGAAEVGAGAVEADEAAAAPAVAPSPATARRAGRPRRQALTYGGDRLPHVLIVEDNDINRTVLERQLAHFGITSEPAVNGQEGIDMVHRAAAAGSPYDCVLMDLEMPVMSGRDAVRRLRADEAAGLVPPSLVIALTGNARQGQIDEAIQCGMDDVVIKPYQLDKLLQTVERRVRERDEAARARDPAAAD